MGPQSSHEDEVNKGKKMYAKIKPAKSLFRTTVFVALLASTISLAFMEVSTPRAAATTTYCKAVSATKVGYAYIGKVWQYTVGVSFCYDGTRITSMWGLYGLQVTYFPLYSSAGHTESVYEGIPGSSLIGVHGQATFNYYAAWWTQTITVDIYLWLYGNGSTSSA